MGTWRRIPMFRPSKARLAAMGMMARSAWNGVDSDLGWAGRLIECLSACRTGSVLAARAQGSASRTFSGKVTFV